MKNVKNNEAIIKSFDENIKQSLNLEELNNKIKKMEERVGSEMPEENKKIFARNQFKQSLNANKSDKEFVEFFWNRHKERILKAII